jgi:hypothetical protein
MAERFCELLIARVFDPFIEGWGVDLMGSIRIERGLFNCATLTRKRSWLLKAC